ncbi:helix-turn-helix transcriptional regulator [Actinomadura macra]|uniref:helix-turn-helix transcriptional regulator n=1 Tax=Actinomadura macra TaxID=46164 RepID=UPI000833230D|nr:LuxR family transcriptional regulator [Actinomadura macra]
MLYGRETEQTRISSLLAGARDDGRSGALVLRGEAGIGKSALLAEAADGVPRVLRAVGIEAESGIAFAGLSQLLWPVRDRLDALPDAQAAALRSALSGPGATETAPQDRFTTGLAVLTLLADLADEDRPVLCVVDDAQWFDTATAEALLFAARRLAAEGVVMLFAARDESFARTGLPELRLDRLNPDDARRLAAARHVPPAVRDWIVRESKGNPLALLEFGAAGHLLQDGTRPLPVTDQVVASFRNQISALPEKTRLMLLIAAAEGRGYMPSLLGGARALGVGLSDLEAAERARLVEVTGRTITFRHPLIRAASYQGAVAAQRIAVHQALADSSDDGDCRARHRASAAMAPDEEVAADLQAAAERARDRAGYATAAALFRQAADLTPTAGARAARLGAAAETILQAGHPTEAEQLAAMAAKLTGDPEEHARLGRVRATVEYERGDPRAAARLMVEHAAHAAPDDRIAMLRTGAAYAWTSGEAPAVLRAAALLPGDRTVQGLAHLVDGDHERGVPLLSALVSEARSVLASPEPTGGRDDWADCAPGEAEPHGRPLDPAGRFQAAQLALILGDDEAALALADAEAARCRRHGLIGALPNVLQTQAQTRIAAGRHADAEAIVAEAIALAHDTGLSRREGRLGAVLARIPAIEGDEARLHELIDKAPPPHCGLASNALALLELGLGRYDDALRHLDEIVQGPRRYSAEVMLSAADQIEAAVRSGRADQARPVFARFRAWAEAGKQPWALAVALRCEALLEDADDPEEPYVRAILLHEQSARPFERARTELLYGEWLRRSRRRSDSRTPLRSAADIFERLRATPWLNRARAELRATGEAGTTSTPTAPDLLDRLTPQELQVVRLAADGTSSREIAAQLFLSPRTVEYHLYKAYPKLGISSRKELSRLAAP